MTRFGYTLMTQQNGPKDLVRYAVSAEHRGLDFEVSSDHFSPWLASQGHAPNAWVVLGAVAQATERVDLYTYVTCATMRYHPVIVAQQAATLQILADGRFTLGLGSAKTSTSMWSARVGRPSRNGKTCFGRLSRSSARCSAVTWSTGAATITRWIPHGCGTCPMFPSA
jgi:alkanesulfonate monooxygenase SsuD/methylene tetrahydromethanopterin reductase-like flavin-dependent oxidoreductase (luciferase family)